MAQADQSYRKPRPSRSMEQAPDGSYKVGYNPYAPISHCRWLLLTCFAALSIEKSQSSPSWTQLRLRSRDHMVMQHPGWLRRATQQMLCCHPTK